MRDYTYKSYRLYVEIIKQGFPVTLTFSELFRKKTLPKSFCVLRHDVDRDPQASLRMAKLEHEIGLRATYYFRTKRHTFKPGIIKEIHSLGHDIGYHYESLSDTRGDIEKALVDFRVNLEKLRSIVPVETIAMHGRPLLRYDNRDLWRVSENHERLLMEYGILGEVYLDIDYTDIAYITDASREWGSGQTANIRDHVETRVRLPFNDSSGLVEYLQYSCPERLVWQIHPERWHDNHMFWMRQYFQDQAVNAIKRGLRMLKYYS